MATGLHAVNALASISAVAETKDAWPTLLNFICFLHRGPLVARPKAFWVKLCRLDCKSSGRPSASCAVHRFRRPERTLRGRRQVTLHGFWLDASRRSALFP